MRSEDRYDSLIQYYAGRWGLDWRLIKAQMLAESSANPTAVSPAGAKGLMQFMPATWAEWGNNGDPWNPEHSIEAGCRYMAHLYRCYAEIPGERERYRFALGAYNAGRGNINKMLAKARGAVGQPESFAEWEASGSRPGPWQTWEFASRFLSCVTGTRANETIGYVRKITGRTREEMYAWS